MVNDKQNPAIAIGEDANTQVYAVIVTHNIGKKVLEGVASLLPQVRHVIVVDNNSTDNTLAIMQEYVLQQVGRITVMVNTVNNLAKAQNMGIAEAKKNGAAWVLLMDHDSVASEGMVDCLLSHYQQLHTEKAPLAAIVPNLQDRFSMRQASYLTHVGGVLPWRKHFSNKPLLPHLLVAIASGSLIPMQVLDAMGGMDEDFCIDQVDFEWCLRAVSRGYHIVAVREAVLHHQLGRCRDFQWQKLCVTTTNHAPFRRYFIYRNRLRLWRRYGIKLPAFIVFDICAVGYDIAKIVCLEADKKRKLQAIWAGVRDAFSGKESRSLQQPSLPLVPSHGYVKAG